MIENTEMLRSTGGKSLRCFYEHEMGRFFDIKKYLFPRAADKAKEKLKSFFAQ